MSPNMRRICQALNRMRAQWKHRMYPSATAGTIRYQPAAKRPHERGPALDAWKAARALARRTVWP